MFAITESDGRWIVTILEDGTNAIEKSFASHGRAKAWATRCEAARLRYSANDIRTSDPYSTTLGDLLLRYGREVSTLKKGAKHEAYKLGMMAQMTIGGIRIADLTSKALATYRNERLATVSNSTVRGELSLIRRTIETARREWGFEIAHNVAAMVTLPKPGEARDRRLEAGELEALGRYLSPNPVAWAVVEFAVESAMRRGEILGMTWRNVNLGQRTVHLPTTKNGKPRTVPMTDRGLEILEGLKVHGERVFPIDIHALRWAWTEACRRAGIDGLRFHDLRHEGVSRLFEMGLSVPEVQMMSGHRTASCLFRYTNLRPLDLARKLKGRKRPANC